MLALHPSQMERVLHAGVTRQEVCADFGQEWHRNAAEPSVHSGLRRHFCDNQGCDGDAVQDTAPFYSLQPDLCHLNHHPVCGANEAIASFFVAAATPPVQEQWLNVTISSLEYFRQVEKSGKPLIITDRGKPVLKVTPFSENPEDALKELRNSVVKFKDPTRPVGESDWDALH